MNYLDTCVQYRMYPAHAIYDITINFGQCTVVCAIYCTVHVHVCLHCNWIRIIMVLQVQLMVCRSLFP